MSATARTSAPKRTGSVAGRPVRCVAFSSALRASPSSSCRVLSDSARTRAGLSQPAARSLSSMSSDSDRMRGAGPEL